MKKPLRVVVRALAVLIALAAALLILCLDGVDFQPYMRSAYYKETKTRLNALTATNVLVRGEVFAGFGRALLTPPNPTAYPLAGYGNRKGRPATGVHDDVFIKAAAIRVAGRLGILFGVDALIVPREVADAAADQIKKDLGLSRQQLYFSASHTHCSIGAWAEGFVGEAFAGPFDPTARAWFAGQLAAAAREAVADLRPAQFGHSSFTAREFIRNRLIGDVGGVDPEFNFILLKQISGRTAILGSFGAHATVLPSSMMEYSGDYPGVWQRAIEETTGGPAIYLGGSVGSHAPVPGEGGLKGAERMGRALAQRLLQQLPAIPLTNSIPFAILALDVALPPLNVRVTDSLRLRPWLSAKLLPSLNPTFLQAFRLDDALWISTPCDFSGELALGIKDALAVRGFDAAITSFNGDYIGYVVPMRYYHFNSYESRVMSFYGPNVPDYLEELIRALASNLASLNALPSPHTLPAANLPPGPSPSAPPPRTASGSGAHTTPATTAPQTASPHTPL